MSLLLAAAALSACSTTSETKTANAQTSVVADDVAYPALPTTIITVPSAFDKEGKPLGGSIAEATAVKTETQVASVDGPAQATTDGVKVPAPIVSTDEKPATAGAALAQATGAPGESAPTVVASADPNQLPLPAPASFAGPTPMTAASANPLQAPIDDDGLIHAPDGKLGPDNVQARSPELDSLIAKYADYYKVPVDLIRRTVKRESTFNPKAKNGPYWGLMQIRHDTAKGMGYNGPASGLLDAETNLKYAVRYLRGAFLVARGDHAMADKLYQRGYYYDAKRAGMLDETGLGKDRRRRSDL